MQFKKVALELDNSLCWLQRMLFLVGMNVTVAWADFYSLLCLNLVAGFWLFCAQAWSGKGRVSAFRRYDHIWLALKALKILPLTTIKVEGHFLRDGTAGHIILEGFRNHQS